MEIEKRISVCFLESENYELSKIENINLESSTLILDIFPNESSYRIFIIDNEYTLFLWDIELSDTKTIVAKHISSFNLGNIDLIIPPSSVRFWPLLKDQTKNTFPCASGMQNSGELFFWYLTEQDRPSIVKDIAFKTSPVKSSKFVKISPLGQVAIGS